MTPLIGRAGALAALDELFAESRLVTIVGTGGIGKTRLAAAFARRAEEVFGAGGVHFVELAEVRSAAEFDETFARSLGLPDANDLASGVARLGPTLVVLDNFEQLVGRCAERVETIVARAPELRVLVTSRAPLLGRSPERAYPLAPLDPEDALALFSREARAIDPDFAADGQELRAVVDALEGIPLALELAAARTRVLSLAELRARLHSPGVATLLREPGSRRGSAQAAVLDTLALLSAPTRRAFALLAIFPSGFRLTDAEAVLGGCLVPRDEVLDTVAELARFSLLRRHVSESIRFGFFRVVRDVAEAMRRNDDLRQDVATRYVDYFRSSIADLGPRHDADLLNALHALALLPGGEDPTEFALALDPWLAARGWVQRRLELHAGLRESSSVVRRTRALLARGSAWKDAGETARARGDFELARDLATDPRTRALALLRLAELDDIGGDTAAARKQAREALPELTDAAERGRAHRLVGHALRREGELHAARAELERARELAARASDGLGHAAALYELGVVAMFLDDSATAAALFDEGLALSTDLNFSVMEGAMRTARGCLFQDEGKLEEALQAHAEAARIFEDAGARYREGSALYYLATTYLELGEVRDALALLDRAAERLATVDSPHYRALVASARGLAFAERGEGPASASAFARAAEALGEVAHEPSLATSLTLRRWASDPDEEARSARVDRARALAARHPSDDTRFSLRALLRRTRPSRPAALRVSADGSGFRPPGEEFVALPAGSPLRALLRTLVSRRRDAPGEGVPVDELIAAGWPEERMRIESGLNRAYVAVATLRKKGLRGILLRNAGGYLLSLAVPIDEEKPAD